jgi:hypothetical protein
MNKTLNKDNSKLPRRTDTAGCRSSLKDDSTIYKEEAKRNRKKRLDDLRRCLPIYALPLPYRLGDRASGACGRTESDSVHLHNSRQLGTNRLGPGKR